MTEALFRLGNTQWWVLVDTEKEQILETYNKPQAQATLKAIDAQLATHPDPSQMEQDMQSLVWLVNNYQGATKEHKDRVKALIADMWQAYQDEPQILERAELRARRDQLAKLIKEMV